MQAKNERVLFLSVNEVQCRTRKQRVLECGGRRLSEAGPCGFPAHLRTGGSGLLGGSDPNSHLWNECAWACRPRQDSPNRFSRSIDPQHPPSILIRNLQKIWWFGFNVHVKHLELAIRFHLFRRKDPHLSHRSL